MRLVGPERGKFWRESYEGHRITHSFTATGACDPGYRGNAQVRRAYIFCSDCSHYFVVSSL